MKHEWVVIRDDGKYLDRKLQWGSKAQAFVMSAEVAGRAILAFSRTMAFKVEPDEPRPFVALDLTKHVDYVPTCLSQAA
jgi:hypothetical protein